MLEIVHNALSVTTSDSYSFKSAMNTESNLSRQNGTEFAAVMSERRVGRGSRGGRGGRGGRGSVHGPAGNHHQVSPPGADEEFAEDEEVPKQFRSDNDPVMSVEKVNLLINHVTNEVIQTTRVNNLQHGRCTNVSAIDVANDSHLSVNAKVNTTLRSSILYVFDKVI